MWCSQAERELTNSLLTWWSDGDSRPKRGQTPAVFKPPKSSFLTHTHTQERGRFIWTKNKWALLLLWICCNVAFNHLNTSCFDLQQRRGPTCPENITLQIRPNHLLPLWPSDLWVHFLKKKNKRKSNTASRLWMTNRCSSPCREQSGHGACSSPRTQLWYLWVVWPHWLLYTADAAL